MSTREDEVAEKVRLIAHALVIAGVHTVDEMLALDSDGIRARVVSLVRGPRAIDGRSPEYLEGLFDALVEDPRATRPLPPKSH